MLSRLHLMCLKMVQVAVSILLLTGVLGAPFVSEEEANEFIQLKRQTRYSQNYWDPSSSQNAWGYTLAKQLSELWTALRTTTQYYMDLGSFAFDPALTRWATVAPDWEPSSEGRAVTSSSTEERMAWYGLATLSSALLPAELGPQSAAATLWLPSSEGSSAEVRVAWNGIAPPKLPSWWQGSAFRTGSSANRHRSVATQL
ncbi:hypothetical protein UY3_04918 [Chelonia mydas]|uniref:Uncharacterized protein n=1 Tax=Chelonia mydas TaxID=8469 RepID=M7C0I3_CHEMY|nr:hypothetical protein UY3_04918 [Chelonia mydas]